MFLGCSCRCVRNHFLQLLHSKPFSSGQNVRHQRSISCNVQGFSQLQKATQLGIPDCWYVPMGTHCSFIFRGYGAPYIGGVKPFKFHGFWVPMVDSMFNNKHLSFFPGGRKKNILVSAISWHTKRLL